MYLETRHATDVISRLEDAQDVGFTDVVFEMRPTELPLHPSDFYFFDNRGDALDLWDRMIGPPYGDDNHNPVYIQRIDQLLEAVKIANGLNEQESIHHLNHQNMNLNNLEDLRKEVGMLGFSKQSVDQLEPQMRTGTGYFNIREQLPGDTGIPVELTLHLRKSNESEYYNLNKFEAVASRIPPAPPGQQYMVLTENKDKPDVPLVKTFDAGHDAVEFFKKQKGNVELAVGESPQAKQLLASRERGAEKENYVNNDFRQAFYGSATSQTFYVNKGAGFTAQQAANMVQGRTVHRDNMLNPASGETYQAWIRLDYDQPKDNYGNYKLKQMNDPSFGFDLNQTMDLFKVKDLADPAKKEQIVAAMYNGDRVPVTVSGKDNKEQQVMMEANPRYKKMDFFTEQGDRLKRELFQKRPDLKLDLGKDQGKVKDKSQGAGMSV